MMTREIGLVSCVKTKQDKPAIPRDLYQSSYFEKMRAYAQQNHDEWWILSAKYGLLDPDGDPIQPYEQTLRNATKAEKRSWAEQVAEEMQERGLLHENTTLVFHAGKDYYEELLPHLVDHDVRIPTKGLQIGDTEAWYKERL